MFAGRSLWAVPQVIEHGWVRLVPSNVLVLATVWKTRSLVEIKLTYCDSTPQSSPALMEDLYARSDEGRLWRPQTWLHAHLAATTAWALGLSIDDGWGSNQPSLSGTEWCSISVEDILDHIDAWYAASGPDEAREAKRMFVSLCGCADPGRWSVRTPREGKYQLAMDDLVIAASPAMCGRLQAFVNDVRAAIATPTGLREGLRSVPLAAGVRVADAESSGERHWVCFNVRDLLAPLGSPSRESGYSEMYKVQQAVEPGIELGEGEIANMMMFGDVLAVCGTPRILRSIDEAINQRRAH